MKKLFKFYNSLDLPLVKLLWNAYYMDGKIPDMVDRKGSF
jgi:hypothetical protein